MAISFIASSSAAGNDLTISYPAGDIEGDLLVLVTTGTSTPPTPTGWTQRYAQGTGRCITIFTRYVEGGEPNSLTLTTSSGSRASMLCYRGAGSYDVVGTVATGTTATATTNSQNTTYANDFVLSIFARTTTASTFTNPAGTNTRVNSPSQTALNGLLIADELQAAAGATTARSTTLSVAGAWAAVNISFVPTRTLYWVGGTGTWNQTSTGNWALSSNGSPTGILPPVPNEDAIIDTNSGTGTITCTAGVCNNLNVTASQAIVLGAAASTLSVYGDLTFPAGGSFSANTNANTITLAAGSAHTVTTNGKSFSSLTFNGTGGNWTLPSALTASATVTLTNGTITLSTNTTTLTCAAFSSTNTNTRAIAFGSGNITTTGSGTAFTTATATGLTYTGTPTINISNNSATATTVTAGTTGGASTNAFNFNFTTGTYVLTLAGTSVIRSLNFTGFTGSFTQVSLTIFGDLTLVAGMTYTESGNALTFAATSGVQLITSAGRTLGSITQSGVGGTVRLAAGTTNLQTTRTYTLTAGTLDLGTNTATLSCGSFSSSNSNTRQIQFGTGNITVTGSGLVVWNTATATNFSYTGTPTVNVSGGSTARTVTAHTTGGTETNTVNFNFTAGTYTLTITGGSFMRSLDFTGFAGSYTQTAVTIYGDFTASSGMTYTQSGNDLVFAATSGVQLITSAGITLGSITQSGVGGTVRLATSTTISSGRNYIFTTGTLDLATNNATLSVGTFNANNANTRQIQFGTAAISCTTWNSSNATNFTYTGTPTVTMSGASLTITANVTGGTESNALNFAVANATSSFTLTTGSVLRSLTFSGTNVWAPVNSSAYTFYGDLTLVSTLTLTLPASLTFNFSGTLGTQTITSAGKTLGAVTQNITESSVVLGDNFVSNATYTLNKGSFNANNNNFTAAIFSSNLGFTRTITMGSGTWTLSGTGTVWDIGAAGLTFNANTSTIVLSDTSTATKTFAGGGRTYNNLTIGGTSGVATYNITGANTFATLSANKVVSSTIVFPIATTTVTNFAINGSSRTNPITITSATSGSQATLNVSNAFTANILLVYDSNLSSANGTVTNGGLSGNTTGWTVGAGSSYFALLTSSGIFTVPSSWNNSNNTINIIGGGGGGGGGSNVNNVRAGGGGGGGGGYARIVNQSYTTGQSITYSIGEGGGGSIGGASSTAANGQASRWNVSAFSTISFQSALLSRETSPESPFIDVVRPTTYAAGNLMVMIVNSQSSSNTWTTPAGWTAGDNNANGRAVFYRIASGAEPSDYRVTQSSIVNATGTILIYSNAQWGGDGANTGSSTTVTPSTSVSLNNSTVIFCGFSALSSRSFSTPTGYTSRLSDSDATSPSQTVFDLSGVSAGSYTAPSSTVTGGSANAFLVALYPLASTSSVTAGGGTGGSSNSAGGGTSTGGAGGAGVSGTINYTGGTGGAGSVTNSVSNTNAGGGGGGGAAGYNGDGGNGGTGFAGTSNSTTAGGGGGGNGGGFAGGNASSSTGGTGGNNILGLGGGTPPGGSGSNGGGGAGINNNNNAAGSGGNGTDLFMNTGSGGGSGGSAANQDNTGAAAGLHGGGGGGGGANNGVGAGGAKGVIVVLWGTVPPSPSGPEAANFFLFF